MSKERRRVPKLRFPGFTEDWEQRKLSDVLVERNEQQVETREYPLMSFVQGLGVTPKGERYDRSFLVLDQSKKYKRTELGDFIYSSNNLETGSIGINKTGKAVISPVYSIFQGVSIGDSQFIGIMSLLPRFIAKMIRFRQGVVYGQWRIHETDFLDISVLIPSVDERTKITQLIFSIEELITLHQRKLDNLKLKKKALLQKLFPKNGERYPELRFPGFTDAWEQREFSDIFAEVKSGLSRMLSNDDIGLPVVRANNINDGQLNLVDDIKYWYKNDPQGANTNNYLIEQGNILINFINSEAKMGTAAYVTRRPERDTIYTTNILRCKVNDEYNPYFIYSLTFLNSYKNYIASITKPAVNQASFTTVDFKKYSIKIPTVKEQNQIADLIETFNKLITLHQRKLDHLQLQKKALLQQMFV